MSSTLKEIGPVWKNEFISLFCFMPWYALINLLLIIGAVKEIRGLLLVWLVATVIALVWEFVLLSILFSFDTTVGFVLTLSVLHLFNFVLLSYFILVVFSYYQVCPTTQCKSIIIILTKRPYFNHPLSISGSLDVYSNSIIISYGHNSNIEYISKL